jgi:hypothetical protein
VPGVYSSKLLLFYFSFLRTSPLQSSEKFAKKVSNITHLGDARNTGLLLPLLH